jgi:HD-like signal output (HDOD) protein
MLLGLLHDIGMLPVLSYSEMFPEIASDPQTLAATIKKLHGDVGGLIMTKWNFPDDCAVVAREADDWHRDRNAEADYTDLVLVAQLLSFMGKQINKDTPPLEARVLPVLTELPAYRKLGLGGATAEDSLDVLHHAREEIAAAMQLLAA